MIFIATPSNLKSSPTGFVAAPASLSAELIIIRSSAKELQIDFPKPDTGLDHSTSKSIYNAWMNTAVIDNYGMVWLLPDRLSEILRTSKANARYITAKISKQYKSEGAEGTYLHYAEVNKQLCEIIMSAGTTKREAYAEYSESIGMEIRNCAKAKLKRAQAYDAMKTAKRRLKKKRLQEFSIGHDELTGIPLLPTSHFSHIRSCAIYPQLAACVWNGLVVNQDIHQIITDAYVNDEKELRNLCRARNWNTDWYHKYIGQLN
jgi:hypothetical protein